MSRFGDAALAAACVATGRLGWRPGEFWAATPSELATALTGLVGGDGGEAALGAQGLARLMERDPDGR